MDRSDTRRLVAHLCRRAGFGAPPGEIDRLTDLGIDGTIAELTDYETPDAGADAIAVPTFDSRRNRAEADSDDPAVRRAAQQRSRSERQALVRWWLDRMVAAQRPGHEKLTFLWHDHFATSMQKVDVPELMLAHRAVLYDLGAGRFDDLVAAVGRDPAMLWWLDGNGSAAGAPNENFAREMLELFTLGHGGTAHGGHAGGQPYTEDDVREAARACTGWVIDRGTGRARFAAARHDSGTKTVLGVTGPLDLDGVVAAATSHPACAPHVVARLWSRLGRPAGPDDEVVRELADAFASDLDVTALVRAMLAHPQLAEPSTRTGLLKMPIEVVVGTARCLGIGLGDDVLTVLRNLGQVPFVPPDVSGWPANEAWLSTAAAATLTAWAAGVAGEHAERLLGDAAPRDRADAAAVLLGVDGWGSATGAALADAGDDPTAVLTVALIAPEHLLN